MSIVLRNATTGEVKKIERIIRKGEVAVTMKNRTIGSRFVVNNSKYIHVVGPDTFAPNEGWVFASAERGARAPKAPSTATEPKAPKAPGKKVGRIAKKSEPKAPSTEPEPKSAEPLTITPAPKSLVADALRKKYGNLGGDIYQAVAETVSPVDSATVEKIAETVFAKYAESTPKAAALVAKKAAKAGKKEYYCKDFEDILLDVKDGYHVYLYGAAGSGKSHTAEQIAERLGLDFYAQTTIQFAHDVRGYGDAGGNFVPTPFYYAFAKGGLYFQDEYDRSFPEAAIVLNSALANGWYDFPVIGRVVAHPNFRFMAAGNTKMNGADDQYVTGQVQDASGRDRMAAYYECEYNHDVELNAIAKGDTALVAFVEDVRNAIKKADITHIVSYRATAYMVNRQSNKGATLVRNTFKGLNTDDIRIIYGGLANKDNVWAKAMKGIC